MLHSDACNGIAQVADLVTAGACAGLAWGLRP